MTVRHNAAAHRYEMDTDSGLAIAVYHEQGDRMIFTHTEVPRADEGKGFASRLVGAALADARKRGFKIVPACSFVVAYVRRHPEYDDRSVDLGPRASGPLMIMTAQDARGPDDMSGPGGPRSAKKRHAWRGTLQRTRPH